MAKMLEVWEGKKVYITGINGFVGSWLALALNMAGATVTGCDINRTQLYDMMLCRNNIRTVYADIRYNIEIPKNTDAVFHLAAQPIVLDSYNKPVETFETNIVGTYKVLEACRKTGVKTVVVASTDKVYKPSPVPMAYRETDPIGGFDPYSASKACLENICDTYRNSYGMNIVVIRAGNIIGGGDFGSKRLMPYCVFQGQGKHNIALRNPFATRPFQDIIDVVYAYNYLGGMALSTEYNNLFSRAWNVGPMRPSVQVKDIANIVAGCYGVHTVWKKEISDNGKEAQNLYLDVTDYTRLLPDTWESTPIERSVLSTCDIYDVMAAYDTKNTSALITSRLKELF